MRFTNNFGHVDVVHGRHLDQGHVVHWVGILKHLGMHPKTLGMHPKTGVILL